MGRRAVVIVLDGLGAGDAPDAAVFGDEGANTLANTAKAVGGLRTPNLQALGLGNVEEIDGVPPAQARAGGRQAARRRRCCCTPKSGPRRRQRWTRAMPGTRYWPDRW